ncbi:hypothetical protein A7G45_01865 [Mycolicibacterium llatzerense]|nr:hypothetical protein [Mycolicibacterium llatzerense]
MDTVLLAYGSGPICQPQSQVLAVIDGFVEQLRDVVVVEAVDDAASAAGAAHQSEIAQQAELVGDEGLLEAYRIGEVCDGAGTLA